MKRGGPRGTTEEREEKLKPRGAAEGMRKS